MIADHWTVSVASQSDLAVLSFVCFGATSADFGYEAGLGKQRDTAGAARGWVLGHFLCSWTGRGTGGVPFVIPVCWWQNSPHSPVSQQPAQTLGCSTDQITLSPSSPGKFGAAAGVERWLKAFGDVLVLCGSPDSHRAALRIEWWLWWGLSFVFSKPLPHSCFHLCILQCRQINDLSNTFLDFFFPACLTQDFQLVLQIWK